METLTAKQQRFIAEYLIDGCGARAAVRAGYSRSGAKVTAHRLTHANRAVEAEIRARQALDSQRLQIDREGVIAGLLEAIDQAREQSNPAAMIAGWKTIGQMFGFFEPKRLQVEVSAAHDAELGRLERLSDAELFKLVAADSAS